MLISLVTIGYNLIGATEKMYNSALKSSKNHELKMHLFLHSGRHKGKIEECEKLSERDDVIYYPYCENRGLSKSWNEGLVNAYKDSDYVIIVNEDNIFLENSIDRLIETAQTTDGYIILPENGASIEACLITKKCINEIGYFDQNFYPFGFENHDYFLRLKYSLKKDYFDFVTHAKGSLIKHDIRGASNYEKILNEHMEKWKNHTRAHFHKKWGKLTYRELIEMKYNEIVKEKITYIHPFNNKKNDLCITVDNLETPYDDEFKFDKSKINILN